MSAKHTPGPWHTSLLYYSATPENARVVICAEPKDNKHTHTKVGEAAFSLERDDYHVDSRDEAEANAQLMAAAPELADALEWALDRIRSADLGEGERFAAAEAVLVKAVHS